MLTTKVYVIKERKDIDNVETLYAEDTFVPKNHHQAMHTGLSIYWAKAEKQNLRVLRKRTRTN